MYHPWCNDIKFKEPVINQSIKSFTCHHMSPVTQTYTTAKTRLSVHTYCRQHQTVHAFDNVWNAETISGYTNIHDERVPESGVVVLKASKYPQVHSRQNVQSLILQ